ncbi:MFS transporter [Ligilactobacillus sp. WILCCON 0076]|uniref:MFS transporter n=1 Tax=Ligilactobacillus ubinensis TaxID=2876789 RepID=A0A9X2JLW2_9LACO|nr:MFS transporter [Ligilactobacillus ubinensis]MCP0887383.1 MFS transporter [Ligilactobacillus ubinensis]
MKINLKKSAGLIALSLIMFIVTLDTTITNIALPTITSDFKTSIDNSNWVSTMYVLVLSVFMIPAAKIGDQLGRKRIMLLGLLFFGGGSLFCGLSNSINILIIMRGIQGIGGAIATTIMVPLCVSLFGRKKANKVVGEIGAVAALAAAIGPAVGGLIINYWSWHLIFFINVPITLITFVLICTCFSESYDLTIDNKIDYLGIILLSISLFLLTFVLLKGYDLGWLSKKIIAMSIAAVVLFTIFIVTDTRKKQPLIEFSLFKIHTFLSSTMVYFFAGFTIVCSSVIFNFFLEDILNYSALKAGYIIMFSSIMVMLVMPLGNKLGQEFNFRWPIMTGTILMAISLLMLTQVSYHMSKFNMILSMCVLGLGFGLSSLSLVSAVKYIPETKAGIASGIINAARQLGTCLGIALLVGILNSNIKNNIQSIQNSALEDIKIGQLSPTVKKVAQQELSKQYAVNKNRTKSIQNQHIIKNKLIQAAKKTTNLPVPQKESSFSSLYTAVQKLKLINYKMSFENTQINKLLSEMPYDNQKLLYSTNQLITSSVIAEKSQTKIVTGIKLLAQKEELLHILRKIKVNREKKLTQAFSKTFWVGFLILIIAIPVSFFSDKGESTNG